VEERSSVALHLSRRSAIPLEILGKLDMLVNMVEMARVSGVGLAGLLRHAQQYKVMSQLVRACKERGFLVPTPKKRGAGGKRADGSGEEEPAENGVAYQGATVLEARIGAYWTPVVTLDFASLYPSIMIAHNLSFETLVRDWSCADEGSTQEFQIDAMGLDVDIQRDSRDHESEHEGVLQGRARFLKAVSSLLS
jgi:DNA polymerase delta subunit 1